MKLISYEQAKARVAELEELLATKSKKAFLKQTTPQPLKNFCSFNGVDLLFKKLLKLHDAEKNFSSQEIFEGVDIASDEIAEALGQIIIVATSYLERIGCTEERRALLFAELNRRNQDDN